MSTWPNDSTRRLIFLETFSTPLEFIAAANNAHQSGDVNFVTAIETSHSMSVMRGSSALSPLVVESETRFARLFSSPGSSRQRLIVAFTGAALRLMMPLPIFMQALPQHTDLLILYDPSKNHYRKDIWDGNCTLADFASLFPKLFGVYQDIIALGSSIGGMPALRFAKLASLRRGVSFSGQIIDDTLRILRGTAMVSAFDPLCACDKIQATEAIFVFSANNKQDLFAARCAAVAASSKLIPLVGHESHNTLWEVQQMKLLPDLLEMLFSSNATELHSALSSWSQANLRSQTLK